MAKNKLYTVNHQGRTDRVTVPEREDHAAMETAIREIANRVLDLGTLETQNSDRWDFHELAVWEIKAALEAAYQAGRASK